MRARRLGGGDARRFRVVFHPAAAREYDALPEHARVRFERAIDALEDDPFSARPGVDIRKLRLLSDGTTLRRLRVGERRACYAVVTLSRESGSSCSKTGNSDMRGSSGRPSSDSNDGRGDDAGPSSPAPRSSACSGTPVQAGRRSSLRRASVAPSGWRCACSAAPQRGTSSTGPAVRGRNRGVVPKASSLRLLVS